MVLEVSDPDFGFTILVVGVDANKGKSLALRVSCLYLGVCGKDSVVCVLVLDCHSALVCISLEC